MLFVCKTPANFMQYTIPSKFTDLKKNIIIIINTEEISYF